MKKFLFILLGFSLLFFSCASKPESETSDMIIQESEAGLNNPDESEQENTSETAEESSSESASETSDESNSQESDDTFIDEKTYLKELEELSDPDVTDVEYIEPEESESETESSTENFELIPQDETVPDTATNVENIETILSDSTESSEKTESGKTELKKEKQESASANQEDDEIIDLTESDSPEDIIEILDDSSDSTPEEIEPVIIIPSRKVTLKIGQTLEVMYPGSGWIYMGTTDRTKDFTFLGKKLGTQNTKFTFIAKAEGTKILHFYKNDALTEKYIDDYLEVEITSQKDSAKAVIPAPAYKQPVPKKEPKKIEVQPVDEVKTSVNTVTSQNISNSPVSTETNKTVETPKKPAVEEKKTESKPAEQTPSAVQTNEKTEQTSEIMSEKEVNDLLKQAHTYFDNKDYKNAMNKLSQFLEYGTKNRDEAFYLQGQIYEASGSTKNIKLAIDSYKNVINNYPASPFWDDANKRIIYLTKFYLEGR